LRFPARLLTEAEATLFSAPCIRCALPAIVVEHQRPFMDTAEAQDALRTAGAEMLRFYCAYHAPFDVPPAAQARTEDAFLTLLSASVRCEKHGDHRYASICVLYLRRCVKHCSPIAMLVQRVGIGWPVAQASLQAAWKRREAVQATLRGSR
jgi:hypothetical protein